jgi:predicted enzyme involved in methoxymalonyl-ACP biosynthesis
VLTNALDEAVRRVFPRPPPETWGKPVRLALLGSATLAHLHPAIRVAGLRRGLWVETYENAYGQCRQELSNPDSGLHGFGPTAILLALDAWHLTAGITAGMDQAAADAALATVLAELRETWAKARQMFRCPVIQQAALPVHPPVLGVNEHRLPGSRARFVARLNAALREAAEQEGIDLLTLDDRAARDGVAAWHDPALWHRSKQEVTPVAAPMYGDLVARLLPPSRGGPASAWSSTSTTRSGAAWSGMTEWRASSSARVRRLAKPMARSRTTAESWRGAG